MKRMLIKDGKIVECTIDELYTYWLDRYDDVIDFYTYKKRCEEQGTVIVNKNIQEPLTDYEKSVVSRAFQNYMHMGLNEIAKESPVYESIIKKLRLNE